MKANFILKGVLKCQRRKKKSPAPRNIIVMFKNIKNRKIISFQRRNHMQGNKHKQTFQQSPKCKKTIKYLKILFKSNK